MRLPHFKGLRSEILGNLGLVSLIALLSTGFGVWLINGRHMLEQELHLGKTLMRTLSEEILDILPQKDPEGFLKSPEGTRSVESLLYRCREKDPRLEITLVDAFLHVRASTENKPSEGVEDDEILALSFVKDRPCTRLEGRAPFIGYYDHALLAFPLKREGRILGGLFAHLSLQDVLGSARHTVSFILLYMSLGTSVLLLFGTILLSRTIVRPLEKTIGVMKRMSEGDLDQRVQLCGDNEMGILATTFNTMAEKLKINEHAITEHIKALKRMNHELKESQQEVIHSEKLASVGLLAAGVAHEIGNPLGAILGYINILENGVVEETEQNDYLHRIEQDVLRIHRIVKDLREYSRPSPCKLSVLGVNPILRDTVSMLGRQQQFQAIRFEMSLYEALPLVLLDEGQFQQVLVNLFLNAKDAMDRKGVIRVVSRKTLYVAPKDEEAGEPSSRENDPPGVDFRLLRKNNPARKWPFLEGQELVEIEVSDSGSGISEEEMPRIFDPFFTTKEIGEGTGLGLSVSLRIIESIHGAMNISSLPGAGTTLRIQLPVAESVSAAFHHPTGEDKEDETVCSDCG